MEQIIVTFLHNEFETDLIMPNQVEAQKLVATINEWLGLEDNWVNSLHDLEYSFDEKNWFCLQKNKTLQDAGIWDGAFLRLSKDVASTLPNEDHFQTNSYDDFDSEEETDQSFGYAWKVID